jgi:hypothetical protein
MYCIFLKAFEEFYEVVAARCEAVGNSAMEPVDARTVGAVMYYVSRKKWKGV